MIRTGNAIASIEAPPHQAHYIDLRWKEWEPFIALEARRGADPSAKLHALRMTHRSRLINLLSARIAWDTIRKHRLDDPLATQDFYEFSLRAAMERRRTRIGRIKGQKRKRGL